LHSCGWVRSGLLALPDDVSPPLVQNLLGGTYDQAFYRVEQWGPEGRRSSTCARRAPSRRSGGSGGKATETNRHTLGFVWAWFELLAMLCHSVGDDCCAGGLRNEQSNNAVAAESLKSSALSDPGSSCSRYFAIPLLIFVALEPSCSSLCRRHLTQRTQLRQLDTGIIFSHIIGTIIVTHSPRPFATDS
jgi:hypothetical protein